MQQPGATRGLVVSKDGFRLRGLEMTRLETFTDAAFAFALSLLVISLEPPTDLAGMLAALRDVPAFLASASLLMMFWWGHHQWSRRFGLDDGPTIVLSCVLVFTVLVYVVPLRFMFGLFFTWIGRMTGLPIGSERMGFAGPQDVTTMFAVYGLGFVAMSLSLLLLNVHAWRQREALELSEVEALDTAGEAVIWGILAATGALSAAVALLTPPTLLGLPGWVYMLLPPCTFGFSAYLERKKAALVAELPDPA